MKKIKLLINVLCFFTILDLRAEETSLSKVKNAFIKTLKEEEFSTREPEDIYFPKFYLKVERNKRMYFVNYALQMKGEQVSLEDEKKLFIGIATYNSKTEKVSLDNSKLERVSLEGTWADPLDFPLKISPNEKTCSDKIKNETIQYLLEQLHDVTDPNFLRISQAFLGIEKVGKETWATYAYQLQGEAVVTELSRSLILGWRTYDEKCVRIPYEEIPDNEVIAAPEKI